MRCVNRHAPKIVPTELFFAHNAKAIPICLKARFRIKALPRGLTDPGQP